MSPHPQPLRLLAFRPTTNNGGTLRAVVDVQHSSGLVLRGVAVHVAGSREWCSPPSPLIDFANHGVRKHWSETILAVLHADHPELFGGGVGA